MKVRNRSNDTVADFHTRRVAAPDEVIVVPDAWAEAYENHPVWAIVPDVSRKAAVAAPEEEK